MLTQDLMPTLSSKAWSSVGDAALRNNADTFAIRLWIDQCMCLQYCIRGCDCKAAKAFEYCAPSKTTANPPLATSQADLLFAAWYESTRWLHMSNARYSSKKYDSYCMSRSSTVQ